MGHQTSLKEGGIYGESGHMYHLYDNTALTFDKIKEILVAAAEGHLEGTEKTDGQNLFISYSVKDGAAKAVRNRSEIRRGGLSAAELAAKFADRGTVEGAFNDGFAAFEAAIINAPVNLLISIFGADGDRFFNSEIMDPRNPNVIHYNNPTILIHRDGHVQINKETGEISALEDPSVINTLNDLLQGYSRDTNERNFSVQINALRKMKALDDDEALHAAFHGLESVMKEVGISDGDTILDYLIERVKNIVDVEVPELTDDKKILLVKRILGVKGVSLTNIKKGLSGELKKKISSFIPNVVAISQIKLKAIRPVEEVIHDFSVEMLKTLESAFILDQRREVERLRDQLARAIDVIESAPVSERFPHAIDILKKHLSKIKGLENISTASEGFVFSYDGYTYKFTGNFAPMNQILSMFNYGRGKMPPLKILASNGDFEEDIDHDETLKEGLEDDLEGDNYIILIPGGFKPPHRGHYSLVKYYEDHPNVAKVLILMGESARPAKIKDLETQALVTYEDSINLWSLYGIQPASIGSAGVSYDGSKVEFMPIRGRNPMRYIFENLMSPASNTLGPFLNKGFKVAIGAGDKSGDTKRSQSFVSYYLKNPDNKIKGIDVAMPPGFCSAVGCGVGDNEENLSATLFRKAIKEENLQQIINFLPAHVANEDAARKVLEIVNDYVIEEKPIPEEDQIQEMSSMAAGSVQVGPAAGVKKKKKKKKKIEEWMLDNVYNYLLKEFTAK